MFTSRFLTLGLLVAASAAPLTESQRRGLNSTKWTPQHILKPNEVLLYGEDNMEVIHVDVYKAMNEKLGLFELGDARIKPSVKEHRVLQSAVYHNSTQQQHSRSDCRLTTAGIVDTESTFIGWDVQMSPVIIANGEIEVSVASSYSVGNTMTVSTGADLAAVKDQVGLTVGVDYSRSWTTSAANEVKATVKDGFSGVMITKPRETRRIGRLLRGCIGAQKGYGTFQGDDFSEGGYGGVKWIAGAITLCSKKEYPLTRCTGKGIFT